MIYALAKYKRQPALTSVAIFYDTRFIEQHIDRIKAEDPFCIPKLYYLENQDDLSGIDFILKEVSE